MKKSKLLISVLSASLLVITACGNNADSESKSLNSSVESSVSASNASSPSSLESISSSSVASSSSTASSSSSVASSSSSVAQYFSVKVEENIYVTITVTSGIVQQEGNKVSFKVKLANANVRIDSVKVVYSQNSQDKEAALTEAGDTYTFTMPKADVTIKVTAHQEVAKYSYTVDENNDVTVTFQNTEKEVVAGTNIIFTVVSANTRKDIDTVKVVASDNSDVGLNKGQNNQYSFVMPAMNVTIKVTTVNKKYSINLANEAGVNFHLNNEGSKFSAGDEISFTASAKEGYIFKGVSAKTNGNQSVSITKDGANYKFVMPEDDVTITFDNVQCYTVTINNEEHLSVEVIDEKDYYEPGTEVKFTVTGVGKYIVNELTIKNGSQSVNYTTNDNEYTFVMPEGNVVVTITEKTDAVESGDPFTSPMAFEGSWEYDSGYDFYTMRLRVLFHGNGKVSYCLTWELEYDDGGDWWTNQTEIIGPMRKDAIPSSMAGMQGTERDFGENREYTYDGASDQVTADLNYKSTHKNIRMQLNRTGNNVTSIKVLDNLDTGYWATGNRVLTKI